MYGIKFLFTSIATACLLAACGGGGGGGGVSNTDGSPASDSTTVNPGGNTGGDTGGNTTQPAGIYGVYSGTVTTETPRALRWDGTTVALQDGSLYMLTSEFYNQMNEHERNLPGALIVTRGTADNGTYSSSTGREFPFENVSPEWRPRAASITGNFQAQSSFDGTINYPEGSGSRSFAMNYDNQFVGAASFEDLRFNNLDQRSIQGTFYRANPDNTAGGSARTPVQLIVDADGTLRHRPSSTPANDCQVQGNLSPRTDRRFFDANITFTSANCPYPAGTALTGVAFVKNSVATTTNPTVTENRFHLVATNGNQDHVVFVQILQ